MAHVLAPAARFLAAGAILLALLPAAQAQLPPPPENATSTFVGFSLVCPTQDIDINFNSLVQVTCVLHDLSRDTPYTTAAPSPVVTFPHTTEIKVRTIEPSTAKGWQALVSLPLVPSKGGDQIPVTFTIQTTPLLDTRSVSIVIDANYTQSADVTLNQTIVLSAQVRPYDLAHIETLDISQKAGQFDIVRYHVRITNDGVFPDVYHIDVEPVTGFQIVAPPPVYVPPYESRVATISILTPHDKIYDLGRSATFIVKVASTQGTGVYHTVGILKVDGWYLPTYWIPLTLVGIASLIVTTRQTRERSARRRLERGGPRRVALSPRQEVLLAELKREDPEAYKARRAQLEAIYASRRSRYRGAFKEQRAKDDEERKIARAELKQAKFHRKEEQQANKRRRSLERKMAAATAAREQKEIKRREKTLATTQKKLEKARKKQAKVDAKQAARDAKEALRADKARLQAEKAAAKEAKAAERAARKAEKAARREEKP